MLVFYTLTLYLRYLSFKYTLFFMIINDNLFRLKKSKSYLRFRYILYFMIINYYLSCLKNNRFYLCYILILVLNMQLIYQIYNAIYNFTRL